MEPQYVIMINYWEKVLKLQKEYLKTIDCIDIPERYNMAQSDLIKEIEFTSRQIERWNIICETVETKMRKTS